MALCNRSPLACNSHIFLRVSKPRSTSLKTPSAVFGPELSSSTHLLLITGSPPKKLKPISILRDGGISDTFQSPLASKPTMYACKTTNKGDRMYKTPGRFTKTDAYERQHQSYYTDSPRQLTTKCHFNLGRSYLPPAVSLHLVFATGQQIPQRYTHYRRQSCRGTSEECAQRRTVNFW